MSIEAVGIIVLASVFILLFFRIPIAVSMAIPAIIGILYLKGWDTLFGSVQSIVWSHTFHYTFTTIPLFILMGQFLYASGISNDLFRTFSLWFNKIKGGIGISTIGASAMLAAATGSSTANTGTMGVIATKEMLNSGYKPILTSGSILAGGSLGILIPPSTTFIIYGMMTEQSIGSLFMAGVIPGIILTLLFMATIYISVLIKPNLITNVEETKISWNDRISSLGSNVWILLLFLLVIGGIYFGWFTPTESAGIGTFGALILGLIKRKLNKQQIIESLTATMKTTGFIFAIIIGAFILNYLLVITRLPFLLADFLFDRELTPAMLFLLIVIMYIILGAIMDTLAMMVVTIPILLPILEIMNFDLIWFGVVIVLVVEMALISPPIGINSFVLKGASPELELSDIFKGALLMMIPILLMILLIYLFPEIALYLPNTMKGM